MMGGINIKITDGQWSCDDGTWLWLSYGEKGYLARISRVSDETFRVCKNTFSEESFFSWLQYNEYECTFETDNPMPVYQAAYWVTQPMQKSPSEGRYILIDQTTEGWKWLLLDSQYILIDDGHIDSMTDNLFNARLKVLTLCNMLDSMLWPEDFQKIAKRMGSL